MVDELVRLSADPSENDALSVPSPVTDATLTRLACERLMRTGRPVRALLREAGLPLSVLERPETIGAIQQASFLERAALDLGDELLGFHLARVVDGRTFGPFYYLLASCADLGEALLKQARYLSTVNRALRCAVTREDARLVLSLALDGVERTLANQEVAFWIVFVIRMSRALTTIDLMPARVAFMQASPANGAEITDYLRQEPEFSAGVDCVGFDEQMLSLPLIRSDPYLNAFLTTFHDERLAQGTCASQTLTARVTDALAVLLAQGQGRLMTVAGEFGMSARTLGRRLADEGVTFRGILDRLRADLATRYVRDTAMPLSQIAWRLGYKDPSAFIVAFRRWTGQTPSAMRRAPRA